MKRLYKNARLFDSFGFGDAPCAVGTDGVRITYVGKNPATDAGYDEVVDCGGDLLMPGFYNAHCHAAMTLFRGYGEDLPLDRWLDERILPAEDRLTSEAVYAATKLAIAEMIRGGTVSFSDMYFFELDVARAVQETGIKANLARSLVTFDANATVRDDYRFNEAVALDDAFQGADDGRIRVDCSLNAEYTLRRHYTREAALFAKQKGWRIQMHLSETEKEQRESMERNHGLTPAGFFDECGAFDVPVTAAHCVWLSDEDMALFARKGATVAHNPTSNLKLASGVLPYAKIKAAGINVALGTDGAASNNRLDMVRELQTAAILHRGVTRDALAVSGAEAIQMATRNGAAAQGRDDCGELKVGNRADMILVDLHAPHNRPVYDPVNTVAYSMMPTDVRMTVVDGRILYRDGAYLTLDIDKTVAEFDRVTEHYFD